MIHELQILVGNVDGVNIICVYYQTLANTRKEILLQLVKGFHKVVQLERHRHRLSVEEMHVTVVARSFYIGNVVRWHAKQSNGCDNFKSFHLILTNCTWLLLQKVI